MEDILLTVPYGVKDVEWHKKYGPVYRISGGLGEDRLVISDPVALKSIISDIHTWVKPPALQMANRAVVGDHSVIASFGDNHRRIRAAMNPLFSVRRIRALADVLRKVSLEIADSWEQKIQSSGDAFNVLPEIHTATLRAVGEGIIGFDFSSHEEFARGYRNLLRNAGAGSKSSLLRDALMRFIPDWLVPVLFKIAIGPLKLVLRQRQIADDIATSLLSERTAAAKHAKLDDEKDLVAALCRYHLFVFYTIPYGSVLYIVNINGQLPPSSRLSEDEIVGQFGTMNLAGEDTTANTLAWSLYELAKNPQYQERIRQEFNAINANDLNRNPSLYDQLPFLNAFIKEVLRFHCVVPQTTRAASRDCVIPLLNPLKLEDGSVVNEVAVPKGTVVTMSISGYNCSTAIWGPDAEVFRPSRWLDDSQVERSSLGPYANLMTFYGGPRVCIGVLEQQVSITELLRRFSLELPQPDTVRSSFRLTLVTANLDGDPELRLKLKRLA
ncbi:hypothetical protein AX16_002445 [Volvariella volvacea WC 439]|nr:hypothetical protein AX16_002445 [Volvariella volvacea WC 439]